MGGILGEEFGIVLCPSTRCSGHQGWVEVLWEESQSTESRRRVEVCRALWRSSGPTPAQAGSPTAGCPDLCPAEIWPYPRRSAMRSKRGQDAGRARWPEGAKGPHTASVSCSLLSPGAVSLPTDSRAVPSDPSDSWQWWK